MGYLDGVSTVRTVVRWTRHEVQATSETVLSMLTEAYMSCVFGNDEPPLMRMGEGFYETLASRFCDRDDRSIYSGKFLEAVVLVDKRFDSWGCEVYMWDRESFEKPILFVGATCRLVDGA
jgi:hypothetical protein